MKYEALKSLFYDYSQMKPIWPRYDNCQRPGNSCSIFLLEKDGEDYYLLPAPMLYDAFSTTPTSIQLPRILDHHYLFAILVDYPHQVMVGLPESAPIRVDISIKHTLVGHISISFYRNVLYAGELTFKDRKLIKWTNKSGHYRPNHSLHSSQLTPNVKRLLPEHLFEIHYR